MREREQLCEQSEATNAGEGVTTARSHKVAFTLAEVFSPHPTSQRRTAFTLAEVLITLGIIGVVAAMTLPTLIQNHKRSVVVQKLKKISTALMQASNMARADGVNTVGDDFPARDPDVALDLFNMYYTPYLNLAKVEKGTNGVFGYLQDGTAIYFFKDRDCGPAWACTYIVACINHKACDNLDESKGYNAKFVDGKETFGLYTNGLIPTDIFKNHDHAYRVNGCNAGYLEACSSLIFEAGWKIPKDYPIKL